jgi:serine/threonine-protein kinase
MNEPHPLSRAEACGRYRVKRLIGRGGMAAVYEVEHETLGRRFALKALLAPGKIATARLEREARALARLDHPHIVAPVDFGVGDHGPYLVMELVTGETLATRLARVGRLDLAEIAAVFLPVCSAVGAAHAIGVVHRDLKPSNVALSIGPGGRLVPKVLDFGVAKSLDDESQRTLTGSGVLGTVSYLSPEVARGERSLDERTDVYSLGVMLFECATGQLPFRGESSYEIMHKIVTGPRAAPSSVAGDLPPAFDALAESALARERADRLPSARALGRALLAFADGPTRALWEREFGVETPAVDGGADAGEHDATLTEDHLAAIGGPRSSLSPSWWAHPKTALLLGLAVLALVGVGAIPFARPPSAGSAVAASAPATTLSPTIAKPEPSAGSPIDDVAPPPSSPAPAVPASTPASPPLRREPRTHVPAAAPAPPASVRPLQRGANGAVILE